LGLLLKNQYFAFPRTSFDQMQRAFSLILILVIVLLGCSGSDQSNQEIPQPFNVTIDMSPNEVKALYADCDFDSVGMSSYGMCGGGEMGIEVSRNDATLFVFWEHWEKDQLAGFILFDKNQTYKSVHPGMNISDFLQHHPKSTPLVSLIDSKETFMLDNGNCWMNIDSTPDDYSAEYTFDRHGEAEFVRYIDTTKTIESVFVKNPD
jgi:hypothetical protein